MYLLGSNRGADSAAPIDRTGNTQVAEVLPPPAPSNDVVLPLEKDPEVPAVVFERLASASEEKRAQLYRRAGDRYLEVERDLGSALRCYRQFLQASSETDLTISTEDNWLLLSLKQSKQKEKEYGKSAG